MDKKPQLGGRDRTHVEDVIGNLIPELIIVINRGTE